jgi:hypothetical protein
VIAGGGITGGVDHAKKGKGREQNWGSAGDPILLWLSANLEVECLGGGATSRFPRHYRMNGAGCLSGRGDHVGAKTLDTN